VGLESTDECCHRIHFSEINGTPNLFNLKFLYMQCLLQMQLLALTRQNPASGGGHNVRGHTYDAAQLPNWSRPPYDAGAPPCGSKSDGSLAQDVEPEMASLLDTPAPRKRPPVPTVYQTSAPQLQSRVTDGLKPVSG